MEGIHCYEFSWTKLDSFKLPHVKNMRGFSTRKHEVAFLGRLNTFTERQVTNSSTEAVHLWMPDTGDKTDEVTFFMSTWQAFSRIMLVVAKKRLLDYLKLLFRFTMSTVCYRKSVLFMHCRENGYKKAKDSKRSDTKNEKRIPTSSDFTPEALAVHIHAEC